MPSTKLLRPSKRTGSHRTQKSSHIIEPVSSGNILRTRQRMHAVHHYPVYFNHFLQPSKMLLLGLLYGFLRKILLPWFKCTFLHHQSTYSPAALAVGMGPSSLIRLYQPAGNVQEHEEITLESLRKNLVRCTVDSSRAQNTKSWTVAWRPNIFPETKIRNSVRTMRQPLARIRSLPGQEHHLGPKIIILPFNMLTGGSGPYQRRMSFNQGTESLPSAYIQHSLGVFFVGLSLSPAAGSSRHIHCIGAFWSNGMPTIYLHPIQEPIAVIEDITETRQQETQKQPQRNQMERRAPGPREGTRSARNPKLSIVTTMIPKTLFEPSVGSVIRSPEATKFTYQDCNSLESQNPNPNFFAHTAEYKQLCLDSSKSTESSHCSSPRSLLASPSLLSPSEASQLPCLHEDPLQRTCPDSFKIGDSASRKDTLENLVGRLSRMGLSSPPPVLSPISPISPISWFDDMS